MYNMIVMSESQFYSQALPREIERRRTGAKVCSITKAQLEVWMDNRMTADLRNEPMKDYITLRNGKRGWSESYGRVKFTDKVMERIYELYDLTVKSEDKERIEKEALKQAFLIRSTEVKYAMSNGHIVTQTFDKDEDSVDFLARFIRLGFKLDKDGVWRKSGTWPAKCRQFRSIIEIPNWEKPGGCPCCWGHPFLAFLSKWFCMKREDILNSARVSSRCLPKAKQFVAQLGEMARGIAPVLARAKECLDEQEERPSDHALYRAETSMLSMSEKIELTMNNLEDVYEQTTKGVKTIFHRECMLELFLAMLQEWVKEGGAYV